MSGLTRFHNCAVAPRLCFLLLIAFSTVAHAQKAPKPTSGQGGKSAAAKAAPRSKRLSDALAQAVQKSDVAAVTALLAKGADPNTRNAAKSSVLSVAANRGNVAMARILLDKGAKPNARNADSYTPLLRAVESGNFDTVQLLIKTGGDVNLAVAPAAQDTFHGVSPLVLAATMLNPKADTRVVELLLKSGANVHAAEGAMRWTALHMAAGNGSASAVRLLLGKGAKVDQRDWLGMTPLMNAAMRQSLETVKLLIERGANVNARDDATRRMYGQAQFTGQTEVIKRLEKSGKLETLHEDGQSVLDWARIDRDAQVIAALQEAGAK